MLPHWLRGTSLASALDSVVTMLDALAPRRFSVLLTGLHGCGKSTLLSAVVGGVVGPATRIPFGDGTRPLTRLLVGGAELVVWERDATSLPSSFSGYMEVDAIAFVVASVSDAAPHVRVAEQEAAGLLHSLLQRPELASAPLLVLAAKQDVLCAARPSQLGLDLLGLPSIRDRPWRLQGCSCIREHDAQDPCPPPGQGAISGFVWLVTQLRRRRGGMGALLS
jgi:energy-coupling factor transporter ATP-binding protein EcfA2